jgi:hypothetical protein
LASEPDSYYSKPSQSQKEENGAKKKKKETTTSVNFIGDIVKKKTNVYLDDDSPGQDE